MKNPTLDTAAIDSITIWLAEALLPNSASEADRLAIEQIKDDCSDQPLDELLQSIQEERREEPGQFGLEFATVLLYPWLLPAIHAFVKQFAAKFVEGAVTEAGKMTATVLKDRISAALSKQADPVVQRATVDELERCLVERAQALNLPRASYEDFLQHIRNNPNMLL
jgi:hypothetical protein